MYLCSFVIRECRFSIRETIQDEQQANRYVIKYIGIKVKTGGIKIHL